MSGNKNLEKLVMRLFRETLNTTVDRDFKKSCKVFLQPPRKSLATPRGWRTQVEKRGTKSHVDQLNANGKICQTMRISQVCFD